MVAFVLTPGQRGDAPVAMDLVAWLPASLTLAADRAYDSDALRQMLVERGTPPVIPKTVPGAKTCIRSIAQPTNDATSSNAPSATSRTSVASLHDTTNSPLPIPPPSASLPSSLGGYES